MANNFSRTLRALGADGFSGWIVRGLTVTLLLAIWAGWFFLSRVTVYAVSDTARAEVDRQAHRVEAPVSGRILALHADLGDEVEADQVLIELASEEQRGLLEEEEARLGGKAAQLEALRSELATEEAALADWLRAAQAEMEEARSRLEEAETAAQLADDEEKRLRDLHSRGLVAEIELLRAQAEKNRRQSQVEGLRTSLSRLEFERRSGESTRRSTIGNLERAAAQLEGEMAGGRAAVTRLGQDVELRTIRAPIAGQLGEVSALRAGSFVEEGDLLLAIVPPGRIRAVAEFLPAVALGRIAPGQPARLRLLGFPSTQYGSVPATVARVGSEASSGRVRVELDVHPEEGSEIPLQHGLPGTIEVAVERVSPATLVVRTAGKLVDRPGRQAAGAESREASR